MALAPGVFLKTWAKYFNREASETPTGQGADDAWSMFHAGMRMDVDRTNQNVFSMEASTYTGNEHETYLVPFPVASLDNVAGVNVLGSWRHDFSEDTQLSLQTYFDRTTRNSAIFSDDRDTEDFQAQYNLPAGQRQEITMGVEYRYTQGEIGNSPYVAFTEPDRTEAWTAPFSRTTSRLCRRGFI